MLKKGIWRQSFSECKILQNLWPAQYIMPLTPSILFPNTNQHTPALRLLPLQAPIQPERGVEIGPVAKAVFSAPAPARSIWDTQQAEVSLFRWHFGQYLLIDEKKEKRKTEGVLSGRDESSKGILSFYSPPKPWALLPIRLVDTARDVNEMQRGIRLASHLQCVPP